MENWRYVAWGDPPDLIGRIPFGVLLALEWDAALVVLGTGPTPHSPSHATDDEAAQSAIQ